MSLTVGNVNGNSYPKKVTFGAGVFVVGKRSGNSGLQRQVDDLRDILSALKHKKDIEHIPNAEAMGSIVGLKTPGGDVELMNTNHVGDMISWRPEDVRFHQIWKDGNEGSEFNGLFSQVVDALKGFILKQG